MSVRNYPAGPRVYVDMDGVMADFEAMMTKLGKTASQLKLMHGTYLLLQPIPGAIEAMRELLALAPGRVFALTKIPSKNPPAASQKLMWLNHWLPEIEDHVIVTPDKGCVGRPGDTLVDDFPEWANASSFPGLVIPFGPAYEMDWTRLLPILKARLCA